MLFNHWTNWLREAILLTIGVGLILVGLLLMNIGLTAASEEAPEFIESAPNHVEESLDVPDPCADANQEYTLAHLKNAEPGEADCGEKTDDEPTVHVEAEDACAEYVLAHDVEGPIDETTDWCQFDQRDI